MNWAAIGWFVLLVVFLMAEAATVVVVSLWFAAGALAALIVSLLGGQFWLQALVFGVVSTVLLISLRPFVRKYFNPKISRTNVDAVISTEGYVTQKVDNISATGRVKLGAMEWTARSSSGETIDENTLVKVDKIEGVKAFVTPVKETVEI